jgi:tRNA/tmRNA/rRNA uracil-C5-methylase (TrmA/RlmC/RlmD family)
MITVALSFGRQQARHLTKLSNPFKCTRDARAQQLFSSEAKSRSSSTPAASGESKVPYGFVSTPFKYQEEIVLDIDDLSNLGQGVGRYSLPDGSKWVVMVPLVLPGEKVLVKVYRNHNSYSEADLVNVIFSSPDRIKPACEYFSICGGCQYQHMTIEAQRQWKKSQVESLLQRIGGIKDLTVRDTIGTSDLFGYRTKITPHYDAPYQADKLKIGFQKRGTKIIVDIEQCMIATAKINTEYLVARKKIKEMVQQKLPKKGASLLFRDCDGGVETDHRKIISQSVGGVQFKFKAGEFFQNNAFVLPVMVDHVISQATAVGCTHLIDTYCGSGLFAICAAKKFETVFGVEVSDVAVKAAVTNAKLNNVTNVEFICGVSERIFSKVSHFPRDNTVIIIDPPRKGCDEPFLKQLFAFLPKALVYVSCDPATQARDAKEIVAAGYSIVDVSPFDLFPQTRHIENVMTFVRNV